MIRIPHLLLGLLFVLLQITIVKLISIGGVKPDLVVLFVVSRALQQGATAGVFWGFGLGLLLDLVSGGLAGLGALVYSCTGFLSGQLNAGKALTRGRYLSHLALAVTVEFSLFFYFCDPWKETSVVTPLLYSTLPGILYTWTLGLFWTLTPFTKLNREKKLG